MTNLDYSQTRRAIAESPPAFTIDRISQSKRPGANVGGAWITIGEIRVRVKILNGTHGLFTVPPASVYKGKNGRTYYYRHVWFDPKLHQRISKAVLLAFEACLARDGRRLPRPVSDDALDSDLGDDSDDLDDD